MPWVAKYVAKHILQMQPIAAFLIAASRIHYLATCSYLSVTSSSGEKKGGKTIRGFSRKEKNINTDIPCGTSSRNPMFTGVCLLRLLSADVKYRSVLPVKRTLTL